MEFDIERDERITASSALVWDEIGSLDQILSKSNFVYDVVPGGERALIKTSLAWGPVKWALEGDVTLADVEPGRHLRYVIVIGALELRYDATIDLAVASETETRLAYRGHLDLRHRLAGRMRGIFGELIEAHAEHLLGRVKVKAEQRRLAQDRLLH